MEVVDAQIHPNLMGPRWQRSKPDELVDVLVGAMDAVGVNAALLDEWSGWTPDGGFMPGHDLPGGARRADYPVSTCAIARYPTRFARTLHIDYRDPDIDELMASAGTDAGSVALRWLPPWFERGAFLHGSDGDAERLTDEFDSYDRYFSLAERDGLPVFISARGQMPALASLAKRYPSLWFVVDHCGLSAGAAITGGPSRFIELEAVIRLAEQPNVALKWSHAPRFSTTPFPYVDVLGQLRLVLDAFGPERVMWASDHTQALRPTRPVRSFSWAECLYYLLSFGLSAAEKEWILGRTVRSILRWPRSA